MRGRLPGVSRAACGSFMVAAVSVGYPRDFEHGRFGERCEHLGAWYGHPPLGECFPISNVTYPGSSDGPSKRPAKGCAGRARRASAALSSTGFLAARVLARIQD